MATRNIGACFNIPKLGFHRFSIDCKFSRVYSSSANSTSSTKPRRDAIYSTQASGPINTFFAKYPDFDHDTTAPVWDQFDSLCKHHGWNKRDREKRQAARKFKDAMIKEFGDIYGTDSKSLPSWQNLCKTLRISPIPENVKACREEVVKIHVNLVDLVDCKRMGEPVHIFPSLETLQKYTVSADKIFPKDEAKAKGLLKYLLREIFG